MKTLKLWGTITVLMAFLAAATIAGATPYSFSFSGSGINGVGAFDAVDNGNGTSTANTGSITVSGYGVLSLMATGDMSAGYTLFAYPYGGGNIDFRYDNLINQTSPNLTQYGLMFSNTADGKYLNIWYDQGNYTVLAFENWDHYNLENVSFQVGSSAPVPEPSTFLLLGAGIAGAAIIRRKRK